MRTLRGERSALPLNTESVQSMLQRTSRPDNRRAFVASAGTAAGGDDFCFAPGVDEGFCGDARPSGPRQGRGGADQRHGWLLPVEIFKAIGREYGWPATPLRAASIAMPPALTMPAATEASTMSWFLVTQSADGLALRLGGQTPVPAGAQLGDGVSRRRVEPVRALETESDRAVTAMTLMQHGKEIGSSVIDEPFACKRNKDSLGAVLVVCAPQCLLQACRARRLKRALLLVAERP